MLTNLLHPRLAPRSGVSSNRFHHRGYQPVGAKTTKNGCAHHDVRTVRISSQERYFRSDPPRKWRPGQIRMRDARSCGECPRALASRRRSFGEGQGRQEASSRGSSEEDSSEGPPLRIRF